MQRIIFLMLSLLSVFVCENTLANESQVAIPSNGKFETYTVESGDSLFRLSQNLLGSCSYHKLLIEWNPRLGKSSLKIGQKIRYSKEIADLVYDLQATERKIENLRGSRKYVCKTTPVLNPPKRSQKKAENIERYKKQRREDQAEIARLLQEVARLQDEIKKKEKAAEFSFFSKPVDVEYREWNFRVSALSRASFIALNRSGVSGYQPPVGLGVVSFGYTMDRYFDLELNFAQAVNEGRETFVGGLIGVSFFNLNQRSRNSRVITYIDGGFYVRENAESSNNFEAGGGMKLQLSGLNSPYFFEGGCGISVRENLNLSVFMGLGFLL